MSAVLPRRPAPHAGDTPAEDAVPWPQWLAGFAFTDPAVAAFAPPEDDPERRFESGV